MREIYWLLEEKLSEEDLIYKNCYPSISDGEKNGLGLHVKRNNLFDARRKLNVNDTTHSTIASEGKRAKCGRQIEIAERVKK